MKGVDLSTSVYTPRELEELYPELDVPSSVYWSLPAFACTDVDRKSRSLFHPCGGKHTIVNTPTMLEDDW